MIADNILDQIDTLTPDFLLPYIERIEEIKR